MLVGLGLPSAGRGTEAGVRTPQRGNCLGQRRNILRLRVKQLTCGSLNRIRIRIRQSLPQSYIPQTGMQVPWKAQRLGAGVQGLWRNPWWTVDQGKGCCWLPRDRWRGCEGGDCGGKCLWRKTRQPWKQGSTAESHIEGGAITIASLSSHASTGTWAIERLAHQMPDALNYKQDPSQGAPSSAWCDELKSRTPARVPL